MEYKSKSVANYGYQNQIVLTPEQLGRAKESGLLTQVSADNSFVKPLPPRLAVKLER